MELIVLTALVVGAVFLATTLFLVSSCIHICAPNDALVISGRTNVDAQGVVRSYRVVLCGRAVRIPLIEEVIRLDLRPFPVELAVNRAQLQGGGWADARGAARVGIDAEEPAIHDAVERFLGEPQAAIAGVACDPLERRLRNVLAAQPLAKLDPRTIAAEVARESADDLRALGLRLVELELTEVRPATHG